MKIIFLNNLKVFLLLEYLHYVQCLHLMPSNYNINPSYWGSSLLPYGPQSYNPFVLNSETDPLISGQKSFGLNMPPPFVNTEVIQGSQKPYYCSLLSCYNEDATPVCACNFNTGNVVSFKNSCDVKKHNCRFDTMFRVILNEICPWEFQSRRNNKELEFDYSDSKYYN